MRTEYTPLPWQMSDEETGVIESANESATPGVPVAVVLDEGSYDAADAESKAGIIAESLANGDFIVRAVNAHDDLVKALESWADHFENLDRHAEPNDPLTIARRNVHAKRLALTTAALAKAAGK